MDIVSLPIVVDKGKMDSRFRMVVLATARARQIMRGARTVVPTRYLKTSTMALEELSECNVEYITGKEARKAIQDDAASVKTLQEIAPAGAGSEEDEIKKEIEKDLGIYVAEAGDNVAGSGSKEE